MILYFSGSSTADWPKSGADRPSIMLTFIDNKKRPEDLFQKLLAMKRRNVHVKKGRS